MPPFIKTSVRNLTEANFYTLLGINEYAPDETAKDATTPYARNFRIYENSDDSDSRVAISKRKGHTFYSVPIGETINSTVVSTTGAVNKAITTINHYADTFTPNASGRLTKLELNIVNDNLGTAPLIVKIYTNVSNAPGTLLGTSSISSNNVPATIAYTAARFIEAPTITSGTKYWYTVSQQSEGTGDYKISSTTASTTALASANSGNTWAATTYSLNFKVYISTAGGVKGKTRYYSTASPVTIFAHGTSLYSVNDATGATTQIATGLNANATNYRFATVNNKLYYVNGVDAPRVWNGTTDAAVGGSPGASFDVVVHKNRLFFLQASNRVIFSEAGDYENFLAVNYVYVPAAYTADSVITMVSYQDYLHFFTRNTKYVLRGSDLSTFNLAESNAKKGCTGINAVCKDRSYVYFLAPDGSVNKYNGGTDTDFGVAVKRTITGIAAPEDVNMIVFDSKVHLYYTPSGSAYSQNDLIYDIDFDQWLRDENIYLSGALECNAGSDTNIIYGSSSLVGALYTCLVGNSDMGKPIEFDYWTHYFSFKHPTMKHRIKRLYPAFRAGTGPYIVDVQVDTDYLNTPVHNYINLGTTGAIWGAFIWGDGTLWGGDVLQPTRVSIGGQARRHQIRIIQHGVDNPVKVLGFTLYYRLKRPA